MDASLISAGYGAISGIITANAANAVGKIQASAANDIRNINNKTADVITARNASLTALQRWSQTVRNERVMSSIGSHQEALAVNFNRSRDARTRANFATNIREAEESGRMQAAAAASGITGSVVDVINQTSVLRRSVENTARLDQEKQIGYDYRKVEVDQRLALLDQLDNGLIFDNPELLDFGTNTAQSTNLFSAAIGGMGVKGLQATATAAGNFFKSSGSSTLDAFLTLNDNFSSVEV